LETREGQSFKKPDLAHEGNHIVTLFADSQGSLREISVVLTVKQAAKEATNATWGKKDAGVYA